jgi:DNA-binding transcriptional MerR regulator
MAMPTEPEYTLQELATIAGVTPRTVRYYISVGLLPSPGQVGPGTRYGDDVLQRVRLIRRLQDQHLPLAEIRSRIEGMDDAEVAAALDTTDDDAEAGSALDYIRSLTRPAPPLHRVAAPPAPYLPSLSSPTPAPASSPEPPEPPGPPGATRSTWERVSLSPDVELHIRRPLGRLDHKRVERLITIARELLQEDQS